MKTRKMNKKRERASRNKKKLREDSLRFKSRDRLKPFNKGTRRKKWKSNNSDNLDPESEFEN